MRTVLLLVLIIITCFEASGQNTVLITKNKDAYYEEFSVLASDKKVKHGPYFKLSKPLFGGHAFEAIGNYADGKQHGYWEVFFKDNNNIKEKGFFKNGLKDSLWVYYFPEGVLLRLEEVQSEQGTELQVSGANPVISKKGNIRMARQ